MSISSSCIFHYTKDFSSLISILNDGCFRPSYCEEKNGLLELETVCVPMVSFCDIPLSQSHSIHSYGSYAIGLNQNWTRKNMINPIFYFIKESLVYKRYSDLRLIDTSQNKPLDEDSSIGKIYRFMEKFPFYPIFSPEMMPDFNLKGLNPRTIKILGNSTLNYYQSFKRHSGTLEREGKAAIENYVFYDEREWRYIPDISESDAEEFPPIIRDSKTNLKTTFGDKPHFKKESPYSPKFTSDDISYIIVKDSCELAKLIKFLKTQVHLFKNGESFELFCTKLTSFEELRKNL